MARAIVCDICGKIIDPRTYREFVVPSTIVDGRGVEPGETGMTDVCPECVKAKGQEIVNTIVAKADTVNE